MRVVLELKFLNFLVVNHRVDLWNSLPLEIRTIELLLSFRRNYNVQGKKNSQVMKKGEICIKKMTKEALLNVIC